MKNDFSVRQVLGFVCEHLEKGSEILDVGAGNGIISSALAKEGFFVRSIDTSDRAVQAAEAHGIKVIKANIVSFMSNKNFDAVLLSMVAHHVHPLNSALDQIDSLLRKGGVVLINDFSIEEADEPTIAWYYQTLLTLNVALAQQIDIDVNQAIEHPLDVWNEEYRDEHHPLNDGAAILKMVKDRFEIISVERCPYFYRYISSACEGRGGTINTASLYAIEKMLIQSARIKPLGLRIVAVKT